MITFSGCICRHFVRDALRLFHDPHDPPRPEDWFAINTNEVLQDNVTNVSGNRCCRSFLASYQLIHEGHHPPFHTSPLPEENPIHPNGAKTRESNSSAQLQVPCRVP